MRSLLSNLIYRKYKPEKHCDFEIKGRVFDIVTKEPLSFVTIQISDTDIGTSSDDDGFFFLENICEKELH